jgi:hypothetical protein
MSTLAPNKRYPIGAFVDFIKYGFHTDNRSLFIIS